MHVVGRRDSEGENFKILGIQFDCKLLMADAVTETVNCVSWKLKSLLRSRKYFCDADMVTHYKSHILSYVEYRTAGIYHACYSILVRLDSTQDRFLKEIGISAYDALFSFNLAPLASRRDMAMLGLIHRSTI